LCVAMSLHWYYPHNSIASVCVFRVGSHTNIQKAGEQASWSSPEAIVCGTADCSQGQRQHVVTRGATGYNFEGHESYASGDLKMCRAASFMQAIITHACHIRQPLQ
jgi:hypothetical protein